MVLGGGERFTLTRILWSLIDNQIRRLQNVQYNRTLMYAACCFGQRMDVITSRKSCPLTDGELRPFGETYNQMPLRGYKNIKRPRLRSASKYDV
jgi:hypothetical protein